MNLDNFDWGWMNTSEGEHHKDLITYETFETKMYERFFEVEENDIVLDVGGSIGSFTYSILDKKPKHVYTFGGPTCLSGDFIKGFGFDKPVKKGDTLIFEDMMHYTFVKTTMFNGVNHPSIGILKKNGKFKLVRKFL